MRAIQQAQQTQALCEAGVLRFIKHSVDTAHQSTSQTAEAEAQFILIPVPTSSALGYRVCHLAGFYLVQGGN